MAIGLVTIKYDLHELRADAIRHWNKNYDRCSPDIFEDGEVVMKMIGTYEAINIIDGTSALREEIDL